MRLPALTVVTAMNENAPVPLCSLHIAAVCDAPKMVVSDDDLAHSIPNDLLNWCFLFSIIFIVAEFEQKDEHSCFAGFNEPTLVWIMLCVVVSRLAKNRYQRDRHLRFEHAPPPTRMLNRMMVFAAKNKLKICFVIHHGTNQIWCWINEWKLISDAVKWYSQNIAWPMHLRNLFYWTGEKKMNNWCETKWKYCRAFSQFTRCGAVSIIIYYIAILSKQAIMRTITQKWQIARVGCARTRSRS